MEETTTIRLAPRYQHDYKWILKLIISIQLLIASLLTIFIYYRLVNLPKPEYFATTELNQIIQPIPLNLPSMSTPALLNWITEAITNSFSFNYTQIDRQLKSMQQYYNTLGFGNYTDIITRDPMFKDMVNKKLILYSVAMAPPKIIDDVIVNGRHIWMLEVVLLVKMHKPDSYNHQVVTFNVSNFRVPETESPNGMLIYKLEKISVTKP